MEPVDYQSYPPYLVEFGIKYWESQGFTEFRIKKLAENWYKVQPVANMVFQQIGPPTPPPIEHSEPTKD